MKYDKIKNEMYENIKIYDIDANHEKEFIWNIL